MDIGYCLSVDEQPQNVGCIFSQFVISNLKGSQALVTKIRYVVRHVTKKIFRPSCTNFACSLKAGPVSAFTFVIQNNFNKILTSKIVPS